MIQEQSIIQLQVNCFLKKMLLDKITKDYKLVEK